MAEYAWKCDTLAEAENNMLTMRAALDSMASRYRKDKRVRVKMGRLKKVRDWAAQYGGDDGSQSRWQDGCTIGGHVRFMQWTNRVTDAYWVRINEFWVAKRNAQGVARKLHAGYYTSGLGAELEVGRQVIADAKAWIGI